MHAVSFVASVAQLAGAGLALSKALYDYANCVSTAPKKLRDLARDIEITSSVLSHLSDVFAEATQRAFVRPGALQTAKDAIAGCAEIFDEMRDLVKDADGGLGRLTFPFKEGRLRLLDARLASLKSTLQLLLQVLRYASEVNIDPCTSQFSLSGGWVLSEFKKLLDEREEARRNYEQLKAEVGSLRSALSGPLADASTHTSEIVAAGTFVDGVDIAASPAQRYSQDVTMPKYDSQSPQLPITVFNVEDPAIALSSVPSSSGPAPLPIPSLGRPVGKAETRAKAINAERACGGDDETSLWGCVEDAGKIILFSMGAIVCLPLLPGYLIFQMRRRRRQPPAHEAEHHSPPDPYHEMAVYGPEGVFELAGSDRRLPPAADLGTQILRTFGEQKLSDGV